MTRTFYVTCPYDGSPMQRHDTMQDSEAKGTGTEYMVTEEENLTTVAAIQWFHKDGTMVLKATDAAWEDMIRAAEHLSRAVQDLPEWRS